MIALLFLQGYPPYEAGDIAGFPDAKGAPLIAKGIAVAHDLSAAPSRDRFDAMDRTALVAFGRVAFGFTEAPEAKITDAMLRAGYRKRLAAAAADIAKGYARPIEIEGATGSAGATGAA